MHRYVMNWVESEVSLGLSRATGDSSEMGKLLKAILGPRGSVVILEEPYVGLRAMTESDAARFFGRAGTIQYPTSPIPTRFLYCQFSASPSPAKSAITVDASIPK
jgi:hypothetical protein